MTWKSRVNFPHGERWQWDPFSATLGLLSLNTGTDDLERELGREAATFPNGAQLDFPEGWTVAIQCQAKFNTYK